jgi:hypothetical protein
LVEEAVGCCFGFCWECDAGSTGSFPVLCVSLGPRGFKAKQVFSPLFPPTCLFLGHVIIFFKLERIMFIAGCYWFRYMMQSTWLRVALIHHVSLSFKIWVSSNCRGMWFTTFECEEGGGRGLWARALCMENLRIMVSPSWSSSVTCDLWLRSEQDASLEVSEFLILIGLSRYRPMVDEVDLLLSGWQW